MRKIAFALAVLAAVPACRKSNKAAPLVAPEGDAPALTPPALRLPEGARPLAYRASLEIDPAQPTFHGRIEIDVALDRDHDLLWLNAQDLTIERAFASETELVVTPMERNFVALGGKLPAGTHTLVISYTGVNDAQRSAGLRRRQDRGDWYATTQFEPDGARRVFPCFDEPSFKVPWTIDLTIPAGTVGLGNAPVDHEEKLDDGRTRVQLRPTPPLPSYLIAVAVGPFEAVDAGTSRGGAPIRIIVPRGRAADAAFTAKETPRILAELEDYTGIPYAYEKLDQIVVPGQPRGAMEHPGLVTYAPRLLLVPPGESTSSRKAAVSVIAHELAHQWFGDLVTMQWWDDLWLNEAFATWATPKVVQALYPELGGDIDGAAGRGAAIEADSLTTARRIRQPIVDEADIGAAFDGITYGKGAAVIRMIEHWIGPEIFRKGAAAYLAKHAHGNAGAADFLGALDDAAGRDVTGPFSTFLDQTGAPAIDLELRCREGGPNTLALSQHRHLARGASPDPVPPRWQVPICAAVPGPDGREEHCTLLTEATGELALGATCPRWVIANAGGTGYYRSKLVGVAPLAGWDAMTADERLVAVADLAMLVDSGEAPLDTLLAELPRLAAADDAYLVERAIIALEQLAPMVAEADRITFAAKLRELFGAAARRIGWLPRAGEPAGDARIRTALLDLYAVHAGDPEVSDRTQELAVGWLADHASIPESLWSPVLQAAVRIAPERFTRLLADQVGDEKEVLVRRTIYAALARVPTDQAYQENLAMLLGDGPLPSELTPLFAAQESVRAQETLFAFKRDHFDALFARLPSDWHAQLISTVCAAERRAEVVDYLEDKLAPLPDVGARAIAHAIEQMDRCIAGREALAPAVAAWLRGQPLPSN